MIFQSELNPYKKLLEEQEFLPFKGDTNFDKEYNKYKKRTLVNEDFDYLDFQNNEEGIKDIVEEYINKNIESQHEYADSPDYLDSMYADGLGSEFNNWVRIESLDDILEEFEDKIVENKNFKSIVEEFIEIHKEDFDLSFSGDSEIGTIYNLGEDQISIYFDNTSTIEIFGKEYNFIELINYLPIEFIEELNLSEDINEDLASFQNSNKNYIDIYVTHSHRHSISVYLDNVDEVKDLFGDFLKENNYYGVFQSDDNSVWEDEE